MFIKSEAFKTFLIISLSLRYVWGSSSFHLFSYTLLVFMKYTSERERTFSLLSLDSAHWFTVIIAQCFQPKAHLLDCRAIHILFPTFYLALSHYSQHQINTSYILRTTDFCSNFREAVGFSALLNALDFADHQKRSRKREKHICTHVRIFAILHVYRLL